MRSIVAEAPDLSLSGLDACVEELARCTRLHLHPMALTELLSSVSRVRNKLDSVFTQLVGCLESEIREQVVPEVCTRLFLREELRMSEGAAYGQIRLARQLDDLPSTAGAFARGELSQQHAVAIVRTVDSVVGGGGQPDQAEELMLGEARRRNPRDLLLWGRKLRHQLNPDELAGDERGQRRRRWLRLSEAWDGGYDIEGHLDQEGGTVLKTALKGLLGPRARDDERTAWQRRADGLVELARHCLDRGDLPLRAGQRPHISITATLQTLRADPGAPAALLDWGLPLSGEGLRRIACDAELTPILLSQSGDPLHVGRRLRTATPRQLRALAVRDGGCVWPGCKQPPDYCQAHHRNGDWLWGGRTDIESLELLCLVHHHKAHDGYRRVTRPDGGVEVVPPGSVGIAYGPAIHSPPPPF
jgi:hypothetical protein